jgi:manganese transport protein
MALLLPTSTSGALSRLRDGTPAPAGRWRQDLAALASFAGPTCIASVAYLDPGNFATNIAAGARYGYRLLWVVLLANLGAMLFQALSAKLGIARRQSLAQLCRAELPPLAAGAMWVVSEIGAMATELAELLGASIGLALLLGVPLLLGTIVTGALSWIILLLEPRRFRLIEMIIAALIVSIGVCYIVETVLAHPDWRAIAYHSVVPWLDGRDSVILASGIVGATVMPHAIFLHSSLARNRLPMADAAAGRRLVRASNIDVGLALTLVGLANMAILYVSAAVFSGERQGAAGIETAYRTLGPIFGGMSAAIFMAALLASGLSSSVVGTLAGQRIMQDFIGWQIPLWLRRLVTMAPAVAIVAWGVDATQTLVMSQVVLSLVLPVPLLALVVFTSRRSIMGPFVNGPGTRIAAIAGTLVILALNILLVLDTFGVPL